MLNHCVSSEKSNFPPKNLQGEIFSVEKSVRKMMDPIAENNHAAAGVIEPYIGHHVAVAEHEEINLLSRLLQIVAAERNQRFTLLPLKNRDTRGVEMTRMV